MNRDGYNESLWQNKMPEFIPRNGELNSIFDVIVVGGGVTGVTTALELQRAGKKCLLVEAKNLCFGTTGGTTAHLNSFFDKSYDEAGSDFGNLGARNLATAAKDALNLYKKNIHDLSIDCHYSEAEGVVYARNKDEDKVLEKMFTASVDAGVAVRYTEKIPVPEKFTKAIAYSSQGQIHPVKYVYALANAYEEAGGIVLTHCIVTGVKGGDMLEIESSQGILHSRYLIWATHIPPGISKMDFQCAPYRTYAMAIELEDDQYPENPAYDLADPYHYYRTQNIDGKKFLIAGGEDHKTGHEKNTEAPFERLQKYLEEIFRIKSVHFKWSSQYFEPADGLAYIGHLPGDAANIFVASGFGGNGMTFSHIAANIFREKMVNDRYPYDDLFSAARIKPIASFTALVKENADVAVTWVTDKFKSGDISTVEEAENNAGYIIKSGLHSVAVYKDQLGELHMCNPTCTHLKCTVRWNQTEKSWDCPCHGARYSVDGEVLTGPSTKDLAKATLPVEH